MKKLWVPILGAIAVLGLSSCDKKSVDHISFEWEGKTIEIDKSMPAKEVFKLIKGIISSSSDEYTMTFSPSQTAACQLVDETIKTERYDNYLDYSLKLKTGSTSVSYKDTYTQYSPAYESTEDITTLHGTINKYFHSKNDETEKETNDYVDFYGVQTTLTPGQQGYEEGNIYRHYYEESYSIGNYGYDAEQKKKTMKYFNSRADEFEQNLNKHSYENVRSLLDNAIFSYNASIYFLDDVDDSLSEYVHYSFILTKKAIQLEYHLDFDLNLAYMIPSLFEDYQDLILEDITEAKKNGNFYEVKVEIEYPSNSNEYPIVSKLYQTSVMNSKESGTYDESVADASLIGKKYSYSSEIMLHRTFEHLALSTDEIYKLRDDLINKVEK